jgi:hypothetical protein
MTSSAKLSREEPDGEICASGSVGGEGGNILAYPAVKAEGVYKGRHASIDVARVHKMKAQGLGAAPTAKALGIGRASVSRVQEADYGGAQNGLKDLLAGAKTYRANKASVTRTSICAPGGSQSRNAPSIGS